MRLQKEQLHEAERFLKESRQRYERLYQKFVSLFDFAPMGYLVVEPPGTIREANLTAAILLGLPRAEVVGRQITDFIHRDYQNHFYLQQACCVKEDHPVRCDLMMVAGDGRGMNAHLQMQVHPADEQQNRQIRVAFSDVSEQLQLAKDLSLSHQCLQAAAEASAIDPLLKNFVAAIKSYTACDAVGVRLLDDDGHIPYMAYDGFSKQFYELESPLSIRTDTCMCCDIIKGRTDPGKDFFTSAGSFYTNSSSRLLATFPPSEIGATRNVCNACGYESVALIPIRNENRIVGLIHVADRRENMIPLGMVQELERAALRMGLSIRRFADHEELDRMFRELDYLSSRMLNVQEDEQRRIAIELHDQTGQNLNVLKLQLANIHNQLRRDQPLLKGTCLKAQTLANTIIEDIRRISYGLRPAALDTLGLAAAVREMAGEFQDYAHITVDVDIGTLDRIVQHNARIILYRIFQEAMTNIFKHAGASSVRMRARHEDSHITVVIEDDGRGFDVANSDSAEGARGLGLDAIRLRARMIGATIVLRSRPGQGTRIELSIPISP